MMIATGQRPFNPKVPGHGPLPWYAYRAAQRELIAFGHGLAGTHRYNIVFDDKASASHTDFSRKRVVVNPLAWDVPEEGRHIALVKGIEVHEFGHVNFTTPFMGLSTTEFGLKEQLLARLINILEDERIERAMMEYFWGVEKYIRLRKTVFREQNAMTPLDPTDDDPSIFFDVLVRLRYGVDVRSQLSPKNLALLDQIWPFVYRAWNAADTLVVKQYAEEILRILDLERITAEQLMKLPVMILCNSMTGKRGDPASGFPGGGFVMVMPGGGSGAGKPGESAGSGAGKPGEGAGSGAGSAQPGEGGSEPGEGAGAGAGEKADEGEKAEGAGGGDKADGDKDGEKADGADGEKADGDEGDAESKEAAEKAAAEAAEKAAQEAAEKAAAEAAEKEAAEAAEKEAAEGAANGQGGRGESKQIEAEPIPDIEGELVEPMSKAEVAALINSEKAAMQRVIPRGAGGPSGSRSPLTPAAVDHELYEASVRRAQVLVRQLRKIPPRPRVRAVEDGPRYSFRNELRNVDRPMRKRDVPTRKRRAAIGVLVDCSGSMGGVMGEVVKATLSTYLAARDLDTPFAVWGFSSWSPPVAEVVAFGATGGSVPEHIAGLHASGGTVLAPAVVGAISAIRNQSADRRVLLVIHDGQPSDEGAAKTAIKAAERQGVEVVGIFLGSGYGNQDLTGMLGGLFGKQLIIAESADKLMDILGTFLARLISPTRV